MVCITSFDCSLAYYPLLFSKALLSNNRPTQSHGIFLLNILLIYFIVKSQCKRFSIRTILFSLPVNYLKDLRDFELDKGGVDPFSPKYRLSSIICDVASFRLFKPVRSEPLHDNNRNFLHIPFANKGIDAINISNILNRKRS